jgi:hypothetical protein
MNLNVHFIVVTMTALAGVVQLGVEVTVSRYFFLRRLI